MKKYAPNSPEAIARILAMFMITDGNMDPREIETLETLHVYQLVGLTRKDFIGVLMEYCDDISDEAEADGTIHLLSPERINAILDAVTERNKRMLCCALALDTCKADKEISDSEMLLLRHMMAHWNITLDDLQTELSKG
ncbi:hypothetical protein [Vogesella sp. LIG4]|uniref:hypothetical protein n=1 Tax=Vogesella sp. LIG4 TaxID=1192162 RepID=UPI00081FC142|nr:hypothetical protein [Vogesella sp. LIG4]SCK27160.1 hypothetical protein PSELUDRAFT_3299 [Vogesella sp. LIG4]